MVCLETTFLIDILRGKENATEMQKEFERTERVISAAAPSIMEIWRGAILKSSEKEKNKINNFLSALIILPLDEKSSKEAGEIEAELIKKGEPIGIADIMIAAIAKSNGEKLVTRDQDYAKVSGLKMLKY